MSSAASVTCLGGRMANCRERSRPGFEQILRDDLANAAGELADSTSRPSTPWVASFEMALENTTSLSFPHNCWRATHSWSWRPLQRESPYSARGWACLARKTGGRS